MDRSINSAQWQPPWRSFHVTSATYRDELAELDPIIDDTLPEASSSRVMGRSRLPPDPTPGSVSELIHLLDAYRKSMQSEEDYFTPDLHHTRTLIWNAFATLAESSRTSLMELHAPEFKELAFIARLVAVSAAEHVSRIGLLINVMKACGQRESIWWYEERMYPHTDAPDGTRTCGEIINEMLDEGFHPRHRTYNILLRARVREHGPAKAESWLHSIVAENAETLPQRTGPRVPLTLSVQLFNGLVHGHVRNGYMRDAVRCVQRMESHGLAPNAYTWLYLIHGYVRAGDRQSMLRALQTMKVAGVRPTKAIYEKVVSGLLNGGPAKRDFEAEELSGISQQSGASATTDEERAMGDAIEMYEEMTSAGFRPGVVVYNTFMAAYLNRGDLAKVRSLFDEMVAASVHPDAGSYSIAIRASVRADNLAGVDEIFEHMCSSHVEPDLVVYGNVMSAHSHVGNLERIHYYLQHMQGRGFQPSYHIWHILINAYCQARDLRGALAVVERMRQDGFRITEITYNTMMHGYGLVGDLEGVEKMFTLISGLRVKTSIFVFNTAIAAYARNGDRAGAMRVYLSMIGKGYPPDRVTFNILINMESKQLDAVGAGEFYRSMINHGIEPDARTYAPLVTMHSKRVDLPRARALQRHMLTLAMASGSIVPHNALLTGLVRKRDVTGAIDEYNFATTVHNAPPDTATFDMLVRVHAHDGDVEGARRWFDRCAEVGVPRDTTLWNALLTAYVVKGDHDAAFGVFEEMKKEGFRPDIFTATLMLKVGLKNQAAEAERSEEQRVRTGGTPTRVRPPPRRSVTGPSLRRDDAVARPPNRDASQPLPPEEVREPPVSVPSSAGDDDPVDISSQSAASTPVVSDEELVAFAAADVDEVASPSSQSDTPTSHPKVS
ncbi:hypothetical protein HKX48_004106 [Thoreauomyces humboldtii]|nr:hypothetical protein HKX48_004106 [Thoreauomyces humboldtii]